MSEVFESFNPARPQYKLYSQTGIDLATVLGTLVAGSLLLAANLRHLGDRNAARNTIILGLVGSFSLVWAVFRLPPAFDAVPGGVFLLLQVGAIHAYGKWKQAEALQHHQESAGVFHSKWRAAGIALLATPLSLAVIVLAGVTVSAPDNVQISIVSPTLVEQGDNVEINIRIGNTALVEQTLVAVDISSSYLDGIVIEGSEPPFLSSEQLPFGGTSYSYDLVLPPQSATTITFVALAAGEGDHRGFLNVCINSDVSCISYEVHTTSASIPSLTKAVEIDPSDPEPHNQLAFLLAENGDFERAREAIERALTLRPDAAHHMGTKGTVLLLEGDFQASVLAYRRAIELDLDDAIYHYNLGMALRGLGREADAQVEINTALELEPALLPPPEGRPIS